MPTEPTVAEARVRADAAKLRMQETAAELRYRLSPSTIAHRGWASAVDRGADAWDDVVDRGNDFLATAIDRGSEIAEDAVIFARQRPGIVASAAVTAITLLIAPPLVRRMFRSRPVPPPRRQDAPRLSGPIPHLETYS